MRRRTLILCLALIAAFLISLTGCTPTPDPSGPTTNPTTPTQQTQPSPPPEPTEPIPAVTDVRQLSATVYWTSIRVYDGTLSTPTSTELNVSITRDADGLETLSLDPGFADQSSYDFHDPKNNLTIQHTDPALPYYHAIGPVYQPLLDGYSHIDFMIDFEKGYILLQARTIPAMSYTVASTDPATDPFDILEHFIRHQDPELYPMPQRADVHFCYDLSGTWLDAEGRSLEQMDFRLIGNLAPNGGFNDDIDRNLLFVWPENFGYENAEPVSEAITLTKQEDGNNFHGIGLLRNTQTNALVSFVFNIFPQDEIVILEMDGKFLVSSTHSDLNASATLSAYTDRLHHYTTQTVDWEMTAFMLAADGTVMGTSTMSIHGYISEHSDIYSYLVLDIDFPEGFRFQASIPGPYGDIAIHARTDDPNAYNFGGSPYDTVTNDFARGDMLINTEKEYFASAWELGDVRYLVAATDPNATAEEVFAHFWKYLEDNAYTN